VGKLGGAGSCTGLRFQILHFWTQIFGEEDFPAIFMTDKKILRKKTEGGGTAALDVTTYATHTV